MNGFVRDKLFTEGLRRPQLHHQPHLVRDRDSVAAGRLEAGLAGGPGGPPLPVGGGAMGEGSGGEVSGNPPRPPRVLPPEPVRLSDLFAWTLARDHMSRYTPPPAADRSRGEVEARRGVD